MSEDSSAEESDDARLVRRASAGDQDAWRQLVARHGRVPWAVARHYGLPAADAADVSQNTWLNLATGLRGLRDPGRLSYWLSTTARREALRVIAARDRELPESGWDHRTDESKPPETVVLTSERDFLLWQAFSGLSERCRQLLKLMAHAPELSYAQLGKTLGLSPHSVGPTRGRCLDILRRRIAAAGIIEEAG